MRPVCTYAPCGWSIDEGASMRAYLVCPLPAGPVYSDCACKRKSAILPASARFLERNGIILGSLNLSGAR
jgi:hypothetical protein